MSDTEYESNLAKFRIAVGEAAWAGMQTGGLKTGERRMWSSTLYMRPAS